METKIVKLNSLRRICQRNSNLEQYQGDIGIPFDIFTFLVAELSFMLILFHRLSLPSPSPLNAKNAFNIIKNTHMDHTKRPRFCSLVYVNC